MIRRDLTPVLLERFRKYPVVTVTGPRQSGKTTVCRAAFPDLPYVNLELPETRDLAMRDPRGFLAELPEGGVIDEIQRAPELLSYIQVQCDEQGRNGLFVLTGSQNLLLAQDLSQSLAGRNALLELHPPSLGELRRFPHCPKDLLDVLVAGAYPRIHDQGIEPAVWLGDYVQTYVERDVRQLLNVGDLTTFRTFVGLCGGRTGQVTNYQTLADDCGVTHKTAKAWLSVLEASHLVFLLAAVHRNISKRLTKTPKLYFMDTGLVCHLLGIKTAEQLRTHPLRGAIFETWVMSELIKGLRNRGSRTTPLYFRDRNRHEVDIVIESGDHLHAIEVKSGATLNSDYFRSLEMFRELMAASGDPPAALHSALVYAGSETRTVHGTQVVPWDQLATLNLE